MNLPACNWLCFSLLQCCTDTFECQGCLLISMRLKVLFLCLAHFSSVPYPPAAAAAARVPLGGLSLALCVCECFSFNSRLCVSAPPSQRPCLAAIKRPIELVLFFISSILQAHILSLDCGPTTEHPPRHRESNQTTNTDKHPTWTQCPGLVKFVCDVSPFFSFFFKLY